MNNNKDRSSIQFDKIHILVPETGDANAKINLCADCTFYIIRIMIQEDTEEERAFRELYSQELRKKKQSNDNRQDALEEERTRVKQQEMKTPGRRGEQIKHEEINKEIVRQYRLKRMESSDDKDNYS